MTYLKPQNAENEIERFCRKCGSQIEASGAHKSHGSPAKDPDEMIGNGIGAVIAGDGLMMVAVILSATHTAVSSLLWLLLLIPAFFFFGKGFADVLHARQIRRRIKEATLTTSPGSEKQILHRLFSGELVTLPGVTDRTTRTLE